MLEKTGMLELTPDEKKEIDKGKVPQRLKNGWGESELTEMVKSGEYRVLEDSTNKDISNKE